MKFVEANDFYEALNIVCRTPNPITQLPKQTLRDLYKPGLLHADAFTIPDNKSCFISTGAGMVQMETNMVIQVTRFPSLYLGGKTMLDIEEESKNIEVIPLVLSPSLRNMLGDLGYNPGKIEKNKDGEFCIVPVIK